MRASRTAGDGPVHCRLQSRELRGCDRDRRNRAASVRFIMDHRFSRCPFSLAVPHAARHSCRLVEVKMRAEGIGVQDGRRTALRNGDHRGHLPGGTLNRGRRDGSVPWRDIERMWRIPVPVVPMGAAGLWEASSSRSYRAYRARCQRLRGIFSRIAIVAGPPVPPVKATPDALHARVAAMRGPRR